MNKLLLSKNGRNHIKVFICQNCEAVPEDDAEKIRFSESIFNELQKSDDAIRHSYYCNRKKGILTAVYELRDKLYLDYCFRTAEKGFYITILYVYPNNQESFNDLLAIEKFLRSNISELGESYKAQVLESEEGFKKFLKDNADA